MMNNYLKLTFLAALCMTLPACATKLYQPQAGASATLFIDLPASDRNFTAIAFYDDKASSGQKLWDGGLSLIYGKDGLTKQFNNHVKITANKPFNFIYFRTEELDVYRSINCKIEGSFVPQANQTYRLTGGTKAPTSNKSVMNELLTGVDYGSCYVSVAKMENDQLIPIELGDFKS